MRWSGSSGPPIDGLARYAGRMETERGTEMPTTLEQAGRELAEFQARLDAETARLDEWDAETARRDAAQWAALGKLAADVRRTRIATALQAAQGEREGYPAVWDYRAVLAEYGVDEHGQPVTGHDGEVPRPR